MGDLIIYLCFFNVVCVLTAMFIRIRDLGNKNFWEVIDDNQ